MIVPHLAQEGRGVAHLSIVILPAQALQSVATASRHMKIFVVMPSGPSVPVDVEPQDTIAHVKVKIEMQTGTPRQNQVLHYAVWHLADEETLVSANIQHKCNVHVQIPPERPKEQSVSPTAPFLPQIQEISDDDQSLSSHADESYAPTELEADSAEMPSEVEEEVACLQDPMQSQVEEGMACLQDPYEEDVLVDDNSSRPVPRLLEYTELTIFDVPLPNLEVKATKQRLEL